LLIVSSVISNTRFISWKYFSTAIPLWVIA